jgi:hypothetical protein
MMEEISYRVSIFAEGKAFESCQEKWRNNLVFSNPIKEFISPRTLRRYDKSPKDILDYTKPDLVIVDLAAEMHMAEAVAIHANTRNIPVIAIEELWGTHARTEANLAHIFTPDVIGTRMIRENEEKKLLRNHTDVTEIGLPSVDNALASKPNKALEEWVACMANGNPVILFMGQDESTTPALEGLGTLLRTNQMRKARAIVRLHPRMVTQLPKEAVVWNEQIAALGKQALTLPPEFEKVNQYDLMHGCTHVVSIYSLSLIEALALGKVPVSWNSPIGEEKMKGTTGGLTSLPFVKMGGVIEVRTPSDFLGNVPRRVEDTREFTNSRKNLVEKYKNARTKFINGLMSMMRKL